MIEVTCERVCIHGNIILEISTIDQRDSPGTLSLSVTEATHLFTTLSSVFSEAIKSLVLSFTHTDWRTGAP